MRTTSPNSQKQATGSFNVVKKWAKTCKNGVEAGKLRGGTGGRGK
jgi:hypothetical protein